MGPKRNYILGLLPSFLSFLHTLNLSQSVPSPVPEDAQVIWTHGQFHGTLPVSTQSRGSNYSPEEVH